MATLPTLVSLDNLSFYHSKIKALIDAGEIFIGTEAAYKASTKDWEGKLVCLTDDEADDELTKKVMELTETVGTLPTGYTSVVDYVSKVEDKIGTLPEGYTDMASYVANVESTVDDVEKSVESTASTADINKMFEK